MTDPESLYLDLVVKARAYSAAKIKYSEALAALEQFNLRQKVKQNRLQMNYFKAKQAVEKAKSAYLIAKKAQDGAD